MVVHAVVSSERTLEDIAWAAMGTADGATAATTVSGTLKANTAAVNGRMNQSDTLTINYNSALLNITTGGLVYNGQTGSGTNAQAMPQLYKAISDFKDRFRRQAFRAALISEWVHVDAAGGLPHSWC